MYSIVVSEELDREERQLLCGSYDRGTRCSSNGKCQHRPTTDDRVGIVTRHVCSVSGARGLRSLLRRIENNIVFVVNETVP